MNKHIKVSGTCVYLSCNCGVEVIGLAANPFTALYGAYDLLFERKRMQWDFLGRRLLRRYTNFLAKDCNLCKYTKQNNCRFYVDWVHGYICCWTDGVHGYLMFGFSICAPFVFEIFITTHDCFLKLNMVAIQTLMVCYVTSFIDG